MRSRTSTDETLGRHLLGREAEQAAQLALVRREHSGHLALGEKLQPVAQGVQAVGVEEQRTVDAEQLTNQELRLVAATQAGSDGHGLQARHLVVQSPAPRQV